MNPMVDGWIGDDWFHNGAFRQQNDALHLRARRRPASRTSSGGPSHFDDYDTYLRGGLGRASWGGGTAWSRSASGARSSRTRATTPSGGTRRWTRLLAAEPLTVPVMLVHSLWDQEDIYGALAVYRALEPKDTANDRVFLVMGPWHHGQEIGDGSSLGALRFGSDTALYFRRDILRPFLDHYLQDDAPRVRRVAGHRVRDRHQPLAAPRRVALRLRRRLHRRADAALPAGRPRRRLRRRRRPARRPSTSTSPTRPSRSPTCRARCSRSATTAARPGAPGW